MYKIDTSNYLYYQRTETYVQTHRNQRSLIHIPCISHNQGGGGGCSQPLIITTLYYHTTGGTFDSFLLVHVHATHGVTPAMLYVEPATQGRLQVKSARAVQTLSTG